MSLNKNLVKNLGNVKNLQGNLSKNLTNIKNLQGKLGKNLQDKAVKKILSSKLGSKLIQLNPAVKTINIGITLFKLVALLVFVILAAISYNKSKSSSISLNIISIIVLIMSCLTVVLRRATNGSLKVGVIYYLIYISLIITGFIMAKENEKKVPDNEKENAAHVRRSYMGLLVMVVIFVAISLLVSLTPFRSILLNKVFFTPGL